jgi:hypothetical protein
MINDLLSVLREVVNDHLSASAGWVGSQTEHGLVIFPETERADYAEFKLGAVTLLLSNLQQEHTLRPADPYRVALADGSTQRVQPPICLSADILFVARFKDYQQSLRALAAILQFFQSHRVLDHESTPALSSKIDRVVIELLTLPLAELHNLWALFRSAYQPSLLYRVRTLVYQDEESQPAPLVSAPSVRVVR